MARASKPQAGPQDRAPLSPVIHGRARLLILSFLVRTGRPIAFTDLRKELSATDGNLSVHLSKLEEAGLVRIEKTFAGRKPLTRIKLTAVGRRRFRTYVQELQEIVPGLGKGD